MKIFSLEKKQSNFLFNEEVYNLVKDAIFMYPPDSSKKKIQKNK